MTTVLSYTFDGNSGGVPKNWTQILEPAPGGSIVEGKTDVTITDTTGNSTGIASSTTTYDPEGVVSTIQVVIDGINANGNAIFGLIGLDGRERRANSGRGSTRRGTSSSSSARLSRTPCSSRRHSAAIREGRPPSPW